jgi:hypothetical protein
MEPASKSRFVANFVPQILMEIAHELSLEKLLQELIERAMESLHRVCAQVWLIEEGRLCALTTGGRLHAQITVEMQMNEGVTRQLLAGSDQLNK